MPATRCERLAADIRSLGLSADEVLAGYCALLYEQCGTYEAVARRAQLDPRTVKKYLREERGARAG